MSCSLPCHIPHDVDADATGRMQNFIISDSDPVLGPSFRQDFKIMIIAIQNNNNHTMHLLRAVSYTC